MRGRKKWFLVPMKGNCNATKCCLHTSNKIACFKPATNSFFPDTFIIYKVPVYMHVYICIYLAVYHHTHPHNCGCVFKYAVASKLYSEHIKLKFPFFNRILIPIYIITIIPRVLKSHNCTALKDLCFVIGYYKHKTYLTKLESV